MAKYLETEEEDLTTRGTGIEQKYVESRNMT
jgi:hypothetical protein